MADGVSFTFDTTPFTRFVEEADRRIRRAQMYTVRAGGRVVKQEARRRAPVLKDTGAIRYRTWKKAGGREPGPVAGLLRASIGSSKRLRREGDGYSVKVGPRGLRVHLYSKKEEERTGYMAAGLAAIEPLMGEIAQQAYDRAWKAADRRV